MKRKLVGAGIAGAMLASAVAVGVAHAGSTPTVSGPVAGERGWQTVAVRWCEDADPSVVDGQSGLTACVAYDQTSDAPDAPTEYILYPYGDGTMSGRIILADTEIQVRDIVALVTLRMDGAK